MSDLNTVFRHVDEHRDDFVARLMAYVSRPSISAENVGIAETADWLLSVLTGLGMEAQLLPSSGHPFVYGRRQDRPGATTVMFYGHYDVQPVDPLHLWDSPPFEPEIRNGRIYGRGVGDNKGQHLAQLLAIESWLAVAGELPCNVIVLLEGEEEIGSPHIADCMRIYRHLFAEADLVITADGPLHESGKPMISYGPRGIASFELRVRQRRPRLPFR